MTISQAEKYDQFLERLIEDAQVLDTDYRNFTELWNLLDEYLDEINEATGTFNSFINSLRTSTVVHAHRLFDSGSISLHELIRIAQVHGDTIAWEREKPTEDVLQEQKDKILTLQNSLDHLRIQRNKIYAHLNKKHILSPAYFEDDFPLVDKDLREIIDLAHSILAEHYLYRYNSSLIMRVSDAVSVKHLLELVRVGRKYYQQERIEDIRRRRQEGFR